MILEFAALLGAAQFQTGNADLDCILARVPAVDRVRIAAAVTRAEGSAAANTGVLDDAVAACAEQRSWDAAFIQGATALALSVIIAEETGSLLARAGIDPILINRWFDAQSETIQTNQAIEEADANRLLAALASSGIDAEALDEQAELIGNYVGTLITIERVGRGLPL